MCCFDDHVMLYHILARFEFQVLYLPHLILSVCMTSVTHKFKDVTISEIPRDGFFSSFHDI